MKIAALTTLFLLLCLMSGCTTKTVTYLNKITLPGAPKKRVDNATLQQIADEIVAKTGARLFLPGGVPPQKSSGMTLYLTDTYLKITFDTAQLYQPGETALGEGMRSHLNSLIPILKNHPAIIIQIIGHACEEGDAKEMHHVADNRAISAAEYLYTAGLKQEILAKGCGDLVPGEICPKKRPHLLCAMRNRRIEIFLYSAKKDVITRCR